LGAWWILWRRLLFTNLLGNSIVHLAEDIRREPLAEMDEQGWVKRRLGDKGLEPAKVLEIRVFGDLFDTVPVTYAQFFLDDQGRQCHPDR